MKVRFTSGIRPTLVVSLCLCAGECIPLAVYAGGPGLSGNIGRAVTDQRSIDQGARVSLPVVRATPDCSGDQQIRRSDYIGKGRVGFGTLDIKGEHTLLQLDQEGREGDGDGLSRSGVRAQEGRAESGHAGCPPTKR